MKNKVINLIIDFVNACYETTDGYYSIKDNGYYIDGCRYLFNQILRNYRIPENHYLVSKAADKKWRELGIKEPITNFYNNEIINLDKTVELDLYSGANKTPTHKKVNKFKYNDVFHNDHVVPLKKIIDELYELKRQNKLSEKNVINTLNKIYICRMLKEEDRRIKRRSKRESTDYKKIIEKDYDEVNIKLKLNN